MIVAVTAEYLQDPRSLLCAALPNITVRQNERGRPLSRPELLEIVRGADAVLTFGGDRVDGEFFDAAGPDLRIVANSAVGVDNIDLDEAQRRGVLVANTPEPVREPTADTAWLLLLAAARRLTEGSAMLREGDWKGFWPTLLCGERVLGKTLLIVGAGRIGQSVARRSVGWEMEVLYVARNRKKPIEGPPISAQRVELDEGLARADFVCLNVPLTEETHHLIDARRLGLMKSTAVLVNVARGPVVDEAALVSALEKKAIFAAGLDVFEHEPEVHPGLISLPNAVLLPHLGSATREDRQWVVELAVDNVVAALRGETPTNLV